MNSFRLAVGIFVITFILVALSSSFLKRELEELYIAADDFSDDSETWCSEENFKKICAFEVLWEKQKTKIRLLISENLIRKTEDQLSSLKLSISCEEFGLYRRVRNDLRSNLEEMIRFCQFTPEIVF